MNRFALDMEQYVGRKKDELDRFVIEFVQDLANEIVEATPVITGNLRASWWAAINARPEAREGGAGIAQMSTVAAGIKAGDTYYALNGAAYAMRVEYGFIGEDSLGRVYTKKGGRAMVRRTMARAQAIADRTAARVFTP